MDINSIESQDFDILENAGVALREIWRKKLLVILITVAGLLAALLVLAIKGDSTRYYSSATLFSAVYGSYNDSTEGVAVMNRYTDLIGSSRVCGRAAQTLTSYGLTTEDIQNMVSRQDIRVAGAGSSSSSYGTRLTVTSHTESENLVMPLTNAMASALAAELNELLGSEAIQVMDEATKYGSYSTVNATMYILLFTGAAFILSCGTIFCVVFFSPWVRSAAQCEQNEDLILGMIPYVKER